MQTLRLCQQCGYKLPPGTPRRRIEDSLLCPRCTQTYLSRTGAVMDQMRKVAHDSGDGETIYHCPFCGSGQVIARSDRSIECQYCHTNFTVQVQPLYPAFPQTIDGQPVGVPGMPGNIGTDPTGASGGVPGDPGMNGMPPVDPSAVDQDGNVPPGADQGEDEEGDADSAEDQEDEEDNAPPWAKKSFRTTTGQALPEDDFVRHLAIRHSVDRSTMVGLVRQSR
jgi:DNA-directed RNA polymerase subunit RPC12/RpoP